MKQSPYSRPQIAIVDPSSPRSYAPSDLMAGGLGGTEATILRTSLALNGSFDITHFQAERHSCERATAGSMLPMNRLGKAGQPDMVIVINSWKAAVKLRAAMPDVPIALWLHVVPGRHNRRMGAALHKAGIDVICVSASHAASLRAFLAGGPTPRILHIHNPISNDLTPDNTPRDPNRLLFASSPHKGLAEVMQIFDAVRRELPELTLMVADPGYLKWPCGAVPDNVHFLGKLPHNTLLRHMRRALCLFYPQTSFAETFGLVIAEANAVGTPVLVQRGLGANDEVAGAGQCIDGTDVKGLIARIQNWQANFPKIEGREAFRMHSVARCWTNYLWSSLSVQDVPMREGAMR
ncbi:glycosyltransferase family 4 protein [Heliomarina baculiformis]|uniref:glycosyltransferase family 4 protein n=1 Tax=Heliomarina baculiformis TaxID=2872036 RepID=UPI001EE1B7EE|nr:glycosyltransferase family 4 protein [Heliomarina baculiformis]